MTAPEPAPFGDRLAAAFDAHGHLCIGIDPHEYLLKEWGLPLSAAGAHEFGLRVLEACAGRVGIVKPQVAFYERFGSVGYRALEDVLTRARAAGLLVIADVKRGDVGSTLEAYGEAWLSPGSPLAICRFTSARARRAATAAREPAIRSTSGGFTRRPPPSRPAGGRSHRASRSARRRGCSATRSR